jgi:hypothetical protein
MRNVAKTNPNVHDLIKLHFKSTVSRAGRSRFRSSSDYFLNFYFRKATNQARSWHEPGHFRGSRDEPRKARARDTTDTVTFPKGKMLQRKAGETRPTQSASTRCEMQGRRGRGSPLSGWTCCASCPACVLASPARSSIFCVSFLRVLGLACGSE